MAASPVPVTAQTRVVRVGEFDLVLSLGLLRRGRFDPSTIVTANELWRATRTPEGPATACLAQHGTTVTVRAWGPGASWVLETAPDLLGRTDDPSGFEPTHRIIRDLHAHMRGLRICRTGAVVETLVPSILEQKVTGMEAWRGYERLVRRFGERAPGPMRLIVPPDPAVLARVPYYELHPFGIERRRADTVRRACERAGRLEEASTMSLPDAYRRLQAIQGIGPWTAAEVAKIALGDADAVSVGDFHLKNQVAWVLAGEPRGTDERMLELLEPYRGHRQRVIRLIEASGLRAPAYGPRMPVRRIARI